MAIKLICTVLHLDDDEGVGVVSESDGDDEIGAGLVALADAGDTMLKEFREPRSRAGSEAELDPLSERYPCCCEPLW
jgi:hypothetical protein